LKIYKFRARKFVYGKWYASFKLIYFVLSDTGCAAVWHWNSYCQNDVCFYVIALLIMQSHNVINRIGGVMVSVLASSAEDRGFEPRSSQTKDYKIGICSFSAKHAALRRKSKDWSARNQNNVFEWSDMSTRGLLFQWASTIKIQLSVLV
jgi:hypothetical protein